MMVEAISGDASDLHAALASSNLPTDDLQDAGRSFFRFVEGNRTLAFGGFELYGEHALLRSIVVLPHGRGQGYGKVAADLLLRKASDAGARTAYLLTTDAAPFFERLGFRAIDRRSAPADILATRQSASLCPSTAALLTRDISWRVS
jgi:N-acetylglutamate synthase-like GNAT family acetyltransferase